VAALAWTTEARLFQAFFLPASLKQHLVMELFDKERPTLLTASILIGGYVYLYLNLFYLPATPIHFLTPDAINFLFNARRMQHGQVIYRDFFELTLPGTEVFYLFLFKIFGNGAWIPNVTLIVLGLSITYLMISISRKVISGKAAYLPAVLFLVVPFRSQLDATHHWFSTLFAMWALALLVNHFSALRLVSAGALCGVAACFTQTSGLLAAVALTLFILWAAITSQLSWDNFRTAQRYIWPPFFIVVLLFNAYFIFRAGLRTFFYDTVLFNFRYYSSGIGNSFHVFMTDMPPIHPWYHVPAVAIWASIYLLIPLIYILFFVRYWDEKEDSPSEPWDRLVLIAIMGAMLLLSVATTPGWLRLCTVAAPGLILFVWFLNFPGRLRTIRLTAMWVIVMAIALGEWHGRIFGWKKQVNLPIGRMVVLNQAQYEEIQFLLDHTKPGDYFFGNNELNYLLDLRDPSPVPFVTSTEYTRPEQVQQTIQGLEKHPVKYVYWPSILDMPPEAGQGASHLAPLRAYLESHYQIVKTIEGDDFARSFMEKINVPAPIPLPPPGQTGKSPAGAGSQGSPQTAPP
jgi:hypothetical protein